MKITLIIILILLITCFLYLQNNIIDITKYSIKSIEINNAVKIVQLSDLHSKPFKKVLNIVKSQAPDLIVITGDYINDKCKNKDKMLDFGKELVKTAPVYYITGNHERRLENFVDLMEELKDIGFIVLLNDIESVNVKDNIINILGLDENQASFDAYKERRKGTFEYKDMSKYLKALENKKGFKLVLSHYPENFEGIKEHCYSKYSFDLQLSGHAHGGQFILPIIGPVFSPGQGLRPKYARGSFGDRPKLIVSRGLGNAEFPFRLFNHPEINVIRLSKKIR
ncbi:MAG: metallophosphoesterase [Eubacterium sp.]